MKYKPVIGLEVHVELKTKSKMFCGCSADYFGEKPNAHTCPVCLGLPGGLPVPNQKAIEWCLLIGLALDCKIPLFSKFDRKNYFYPDLPKGYQISQYDQPFAINGSLKLKIDEEKTIRIRRVHMEEDTAKLTHQFGTQNSNVKNQNDEGYSLIDFNRSGVPLVEIVTEPDFESAKEVVEYLKKLQQIVRYLGVSDADMEKGNMRLEPNISLTKPMQPGYKVEVKNINSFRFVENAITYELKRQQEILERGETPIQETRGWDENRQKTVMQRIKEEVSDYRYFPEPDIPPIRWTQSKIHRLSALIPELPNAKIDRFKKQYGLSDYVAEILTRDKVTADYFENAAHFGVNKNVFPKKIANTIINQKIDIKKTSIVDLVNKIQKKDEVFAIADKKLKKLVSEVLKRNQKAVADYKKGKTAVIMFLVGQVLKGSPQKIDPKKVRETLKKMLK